MTKTTTTASITTTTTTTMVMLMKWRREQRAKTGHRERKMIRGMKMINGKKRGSESAIAGAIPTRQLTPDADAAEMEERDNNKIISKNVSYLIHLPPPRLPRLSSFLPLPLLILLLLLLLLLLICLLLHPNALINSYGF